MYELNNIHRAVRTVTMEYIVVSFILSPSQMILVKQNGQCGEAVNLGCTEVTHHAEAFSATYNARATCKWNGLLF